MKIKHQIIISLTLATLMIFVSLSSASADESAWQNLNPSFESGLSGTVSNCATLSVSNGTVAAYPTCTITCNSGYTLSGSSCVASGGGGGGGGGGTSVSYCSTLVYSAWGSCNNSFRTRSVLNQSPTGCSLTVAQQLSLSESCSATTGNESGSINEPVSPIITPVTPTQTTSLSGNALKEQVMTRERLVQRNTDTQLSQRLSGRILLQVETNGEAWYINPLDLTRHYLGRPADAFALMRNLGLGVLHSVITAPSIPKRLYGRILIDVEDLGKAYWIDPVDGSKNYLGRPDDAYQLLKSGGLGISNDNLRQIELSN